MRISVLIATRDRPALLDRCLAALSRGSQLPDEVLIADQSEGDETERVARERSATGLAVRYLRLGVRGKARALNEAIVASAGDWLALTDDDVEVAPTWIETIRGLPARFPDVPAFFGRVLPEPGTDPAGYLNLILDTEPRWVSRGSSPLSPGFCGANIVVRRSAMLAVGAYDARFGPGGVFRNNDDGELAYRLTRGGERLLLAPELEVYHSGWRREADNSALKIDYAYGVGAFAGQYLRRGHLRPVAYLLRRCLVDIGRILAGTRVRRREARLELRGFVAGFFRGLGAAGSGTLPDAGAS